MESGRVLDRDCRLHFSSRSVVASIVTRWPRVLRESRCSPAQFQQPLRLSAKAFRSSCWEPALTHSIQRVSGLPHSTLRRRSRASPLTHRRQGTALSSRQIRRGQMDCSPQMASLPTWPLARGLGAAQSSERDSLTVYSLLMALAQAVPENSTRVTSSSARSTTSDSSSLCRDKLTTVGCG